MSCWDQPMDRCPGCSYCTGARTDGVWSDITPLEARRQDQREAELAERARELREVRAS